MSNPVKLEMYFTEEDLWATVFGAEPETDWWVAYEYRDDSDWDKAGAVRITLLDPEDSEKVVTKVLYPSDLVQALQKTISSANPYTNWFDLDEYDSIAADVLIQTAVYGEIVFG